MATINTVIPAIMGVTLFSYSKGGLVKSMTM